MREQISNRTSIGNTNNPELKVVSLVAALSIPERTNVMTDDLKYSNKKDLSLNANKVQSSSNELEF